MKQKKDRKRPKIHSQRAAAYVFLLIIFMICAVNMLTKDKEFSSKENRMLEQKPKVSVSSLETGRFMKQYESYKSDQFAGRNMWVALKTRIDLLVGRRESNGVFKGKNHYLIEDIAEPDMEQMSANLEQMRQFQKDYKDVPMYMMLAPNAANVISDKLPGLAVTLDQSKQFKEIREELGAGFTWVDAEKILKKHNKEEIYYHTDHHWTSLGAYYGYQELAKAMKLDLTKEPEWKPYAVSNDFNGTLSATSGYETGYRESIYIYAPKAIGDIPQVVVHYMDEQRKTATLYDDAKLSEKDQYAVFLGGNHGMVDIRTTADTTDRLLIFKDSYANCLIPFLTPYYREIIVIDPRYYYGDIKAVMTENKISQILFLYNGNTFMEDRNINGVFKNGTAE